MRAEGLPGGLRPLSQHTVVTTSVPNGAPSADLILGTNQTFAVTFKVPGDYPYYCMWHPGWIKGTIIVKPAKST